MATTFNEDNTIEQMICYNAGADTHRQPVHL